MAGQPGYESRRAAGYPSELANVKFIIDDFIYDSIRPTQTTEIFFSVPISGAKTPTYTNLTSASRIPFSQNFWVTGITATILQNYQVFPTSGIDLDTTWAYIERMMLGNYKLIIGTTRELTGTLKNIINYNEFAVIEPYASATTSKIYNSFGSVFGRLTGSRQYKNPFLLSPTFDFSFEVSWEAIPTYAYNPFHLLVTFSGKRIRAAQ